MLQQKIGLDTVSIRMEEKHHYIAVYVVVERPDLPMISKELNEELGIPDSISRIELEELIENLNIQKLQAWACNC
ncbi:MAG: hypothetical protein ACRCXZ_09320 [Patescibacteria group bacterium]